jgi:hypothetical protein
MATLFLIKYASNTTLSKGKVVLVQILKVYKGNTRRTIAPLILNLCTDVNRGEWSTSCVGRFNPEENLGTPSIGGWVGPERVSNFLEKRKISSPCRDSNPGPLRMQRSPYADYAILCIMFYMFRNYWLVISGFLRLLLRVLPHFMSHETIRFYRVI